MTDGPPCYVYIVQQWEGDGIRGPLKIGIAEDPDLRLAELQCGNPRRLSVIARFPFLSRELAFAREQWLHRKFHHLNIRGEWFHGKLYKKLREERFARPEPALETV